MKNENQNSSMVDKNNDNPFTVNSPEIVWQEWKKKAKLISREELARQIGEAKKIQKESKKSK